MSPSVHQPCWANALLLWFDPLRIWYALDRAGLDGAMVRRDGTVVGLKGPEGDPVPVALSDNALAEDMRAVARGVGSVSSLPAAAAVATVTELDLGLRSGAVRRRDALVVLAPGVLARMPIWGGPRGARG